MISVFMKHEKNPRTVKCAYHVVYELAASSNWQKNGMATFSNSALIFLSLPEQYNYLSYMPYSIVMAIIKLSPVRVHVHTHTHTCN